MYWAFSVLLIVFCCSMEPHTVGASAAAVPEVFIVTAAPTRKQQKRPKDVRSISKVNTATDAALAVNSIEFMELLSQSKNTADVKTYIQSPMKQPIASDDAVTSNKQHDLSASSNNGPSSWGFFGWFSKGDSSTSEDSDSSSVDTNPECLTVSTNELKQPDISHHETVSEYIGRLWFLSDKKGFRFRETIRVLSIADDGQSSMVECTSQYHNGSQWVDCSKVVCKFLSVGLKVKMVLDSELLVSLPLPKIASRAVGRKVASVFETVALDYFKELAVS